MNESQEMARRWQRYRELSDEIKYQARVRKDALQECVDALRKISPEDLELLEKDFPQIKSVASVTIEQLMDADGAALNQLRVAYAELSKTVDRWLEYYEGAIE